MFGSTTCGGSNVLLTRLSDDASSGRCCRISLQVVLPKTKSCASFDDLGVDITIGVGGAWRAMKPDAGIHHSLCQKKGTQDKDVLAYRDSRAFENPNLPRWAGRPGLGIKLNLKEGWRLCGLAGTLSC